VGRHRGVGNKRVTGRSLLAEAADLERLGEPFVLATVVWRRAPSSGQQGAKTIIRADGRTSGWIGGACAGPTVVREALAALGDGRPRLLFLGPAGELDGGLRTDVVNVPMACESEGALELYLEPVLPRPQVIVVGSSPAVTTLVELAGALGWRAEATDDADLGGATGPIDGRTAIVVATQGHYDEDALEAALTTEAGYIGLVASAARAPAVLAELAERGVDAEARARVRAPAGLDLGRIDHTEIAVAVLAELVALKAAGGLGPSIDPTVAATAQAVDPVCGMTVDVDGARHVLDHAGARWYFCSAGCQRAFRSDPDKFAAAGPELR
jgi:xanthine dehydrogenase accessory factor